MNKTIFFFMFLFICTTAYADFSGPFGDFGPNSANLIFNDTGDFDGLLDASDVTVQDAFETLDSMTFASIPCVTTEDWCYVYEDNVLKLYVNAILQAQWPSIAVFDKLLLEDGTFYLLLETGDYLLLEY